MTDYTELKRLAEAATPGPWYQHGGIMQVLSHDCETVCETFEDDGECPDAQFIAAANPAAVLALIAENEQLAKNYKSLCDSVAHLNAASTSAGDEVARLKAECEGLRATADLQKLLPELDDALEELELHGQHSDQGYRKLKDWYRKAALAYRVIQGPMFGAEHGELVSQNTWLRSVVEHYAQQHAPVEPIPDMEGWSARLPGYDLPALLRDAKRYRHARDSAYSANTIEGHVLLVEFPMPEKSLKSAAQFLDAAIDADMGKEASNG